MKSRTTRRHVLRAARGRPRAAVAGVVESVGRARRRDAAPVKRFIPVYFPNGASVLWWRRRVAARATRGSSRRSSRRSSRQAEDAAHPPDRQFHLAEGPADDEPGVDHLPGAQRFLRRLPDAGRGLRRAVALARPVRAAELHRWRRVPRESKGQNIATSPMNGETVDQLMARSVPSRRRSRACSSVCSTATAAWTSVTARCRATCRGARRDAARQGPRSQARLRQLVATGAGQSAAIPRLPRRRRAAARSTSARSTGSRTARRAQQRLGKSDRERLDRS